MPNSPQNASHYMRIQLGDDSGKWEQGASIGQPNILLTKDMSELAAFATGDDGTKAANAHL